MKKLLLLTVMLTVITTASFSQFFGVGAGGRLKKLNSSASATLVLAGDNASFNIFVDSAAYASTYKVKQDSIALASAISAASGISLTTTLNSGSATYNTGTRALNVPTYTLSGLGGIGLSALSATLPLTYNSSTGVFGNTQSNTTTAGYISAADWNTFNNKQATITNAVTGTGVANQLTYWNGTSTVTGGTNLQWNPSTNVHTVVGASVTTTAQITALAASGVSMGLDASGNLHTRVLDEASTSTGSTTITAVNSYVVGSMIVKEMGVQKAATEFTATNGTTITLNYTPFSGNTFSIEYTKQVN